MNKDENNNRKIKYKRKNGADSIRTHGCLRLGDYV